MYNLCVYLVGKWGITIHVQVFKFWPQIRSQDRLVFLYFITGFSHFTHLTEKLSIFFSRRLLEQLGKLPRNLLKTVRAEIKSQKNMKNL